MKPEKLIELKYASTFIEEYPKFLFYTTIFVATYTSLCIFDFVFDFRLKDFLLNYLHPMFYSIHFLFILISLVVTVIAYNYEEKEYKKVKLLKIKILKKYNKRNVNKEVFFKTLFKLLNELEEKELICLTYDEKFSKISKKDFKQMLKNKLQNEKSIKKQKKELLNRHS